MNEVEVKLQKKLWTEIFFWYKQPTTEVMVHKNFFFLFSVTSSSTMKLRKSAPRASNFPLMQRIIRPFRPPLSHQGKYIIRFEGLEDCLRTKRQGGWWRWWGGRPCKVQTFLINIEVLSLNCSPWRKLWPSWTFEQLLELLFAPAHVYHLPNCDKPDKWWHRMSVRTPGIVRKKW